MASPAISAFPSRERRLLALLAAVLGLNVLDALFTILWVDLGIAHEANPILRPLFDIGPGTFFIAKMSLVSVALAFLWAQRRSSLVFAGLGLSTAVYGVLLAYHLQIASSVIDARALLGMGVTLF
jgi:hypothetical protein